MPKSDAPTKEPKRASAAASSVETFDAPEMSADQLTQITRRADRNAPAMRPPGEEDIAFGEEQGITAWHNAKKVHAMWCNSSARNAFASIQDLGWKRISAANDSAFINMVMILSLAEQTGANCNVRIESDNQIHEVYAF